MNPGGSVNEVIPAHLRRTAALLRFIAEEKAEAEVVWRGRSLGTWESLRPTWRLDGRGIRLVLHSGGGNLVLLASTAHLAPRGAEIFVAGTHGRDSQVVSLLWQRQDSESNQEFSPQYLREFIARWIRHVLPGCEILNLSHRSDRANSLSGSYLRLHARGPARDVLVLAAGRSLQAGENYESALCQALIWAALLRKLGRLHGVPLLHLVVPAQCAPILQHRSGLLDPRHVQVKIWQYQPTSSDPVRVQPAPPPGAPRENREFRWPVLGPFQWSTDLARVIELAPAHIRRYPRFQEYDSLRLWGLEFATASGDSRESVSFGLGPDKIRLTNDNFSCLRSLVDEILYFRRPDSPDPHHPYYRVQAERWLEALILEQTPLLFPELVPESVYPQIPVYLGKDPGRVDILGADNDGTLVILELKVGPDPDLPIQAMDYWGRVVRHNQDGDFLRRGYFSGIRLNRNAPRVYLVSPVFSFHTTTERLLTYFDPEIEVWKVSINEDWRCGVRILRRNRLRCGGEI